MSIKLVITICKMIILTNKKNSEFYLKYSWRYSTLKIPHFEGMDNLMIRLVPLFPYCAVIAKLQLRPQTGRLSLVIPPSDPGALLNFLILVIIAKKAKRINYEPDKLARKICTKMCKICKNMHTKYINCARNACKTMKQHSSCVSLFFLPFCNYN